MNENVIKSTRIDEIEVKVYKTKIHLGAVAAMLVTDRLKKVIQKKRSANLLLATGASQFDFLKEFKQIEGLDWSKITVFHLDEYVGLSADHPASFRNYLHDRIIDEVQPGRAYFIQGDAEDLQEEVDRYERLLKENPIDVACIGIGENGHIAFNDPPVADFEDPRLVKVVQLDEKSRKQQVGEGWFNSLEEVPGEAVTLTVPAIMQSKMISCVVPDKRKADAVYCTLNDPISTKCPASTLRKHRNAVLFLDQNSAQRLKFDD